MFSESPPRPSLRAAFSRAFSPRVISWAVRDAVWRWLAVLASVGFTFGTLHLVGVAVAWEALWPGVELSGGMLALGLVCARASRGRGGSVPVAIAGDFMLSLGQTYAIALGLVPLTYLAALPALPMLDAELSRLDLLLFHFDWDSLRYWTLASPVRHEALRLFYMSFTWQVFLVLLLGSLSRPGEQNSETMWTYLVSLILTSLIFCFVQSEGRYGDLRPIYPETMAIIRSGAWFCYDYRYAVGIINFPSFHATMGLILAGAVRRQRWAFAIALPLNGLMIFAALPVGGHYAVDLAGGAGVYFLSLAAAHRIQRWTRTEPSQQERCSFFGKKEPKKLCSLGSAQATRAEPNE